MFAKDADYPTAVASYDSEGIAAGIAWCVQHMKEDDVLTVWTSLKSNLANCTELDELVRRNRDVEHITGRGHGTPRGTGPVLMAWPDLNSIGEMVRRGRGVRALCVVTWDEDAIRPWVMAVKPAVLGDGSAWDSSLLSLDPVVVEALRSLTSTINHNNTISAGFKKEQVVSVLLLLHDAGIPMDPDAMQGWSLAHGWSGKNSGRLANYVRDINAGKRPRVKRVISADYLETLRERARSTADEGED